MFSGVTRRVASRGCSSGAPGSGVPKWVPGGCGGGAQIPGGSAGLRPRRWAVRADGLAFAEAL